MLVSHQNKSHAQVSFQVIHVEIASTCEPGTIGSVIVFVAVLIVAKVCDNQDWCQTGVSDPSPSGPYSSVTRRPVSPFKKRCDRSTRRQIDRGEFGSRRAAPSRGSSSSQISRRARPARTNGTRVASRRRPVSAKLTEVAENWQLVCNSNAARLPQQRLVGEEEKIAACLERCSQRVIKPSGKEPFK